MSAARAERRDVGDQAEAGGGRALATRRKAGPDLAALHPDWRRNWGRSIEGGALRTAMEGNARLQSRILRSIAGEGIATSRPRLDPVAFDDWRQDEMKRLDEERRKLAEMEREFEAYQRELRRAKDREEFEAFLRNRKTMDGSAS